jgi:hypothetical protein
VTKCFSDAIEDIIGHVAKCFSIDATKDIVPAPNTPSISLSWYFSNSRSTIAVPSNRLKNTKEETI